MLPTRRQSPIRSACAVCHKAATRRCRIGTRPWAAQGPVWAVPEESVDEGGGSVSVTVTVSGGVVTVSGGVVTVSGGVVTVTVVGITKREARRCR